MTENQLKWTGFFVIVIGVVGLVLIFLVLILERPWQTHG